MSYMFTGCEKQVKAHLLCAQHGFLQNVSAVDYMMFLYRINDNTSLADLRSLILEYDTSQDVKQKLESIGFI